jgi:hypothetical protein
VAAAVSRRTLLQALLAAATALLPKTGAWAQRDVSLERAIKATYLWKFAPFVEWPAGTFRSADSPFVICVLGNGGLSQVLDEAVAGQRIAGRAIAVHRLSLIEPDSGCQILFDAGSPEQPVAAALAAVKGKPVLTVTDAEDNGGPKGIINFLIADNHVRFEINDAAAAASGLRISSKLLSLAVAVTPRTQTEFGATAV